jgi:hypothetical protein
MVKIDIKVKHDKHLWMEGVDRRQTCFSSLWHFNNMTIFEIRVSIKQLTIATANTNPMSTEV